MADPREMSADEQARRIIASNLDQALSILRIDGKSDYYAGYSIAEAIQDRIKQIGKDDDLAQNETWSFSSGDSMLGRLARMERLVQEAVAKARELK